MSRIGNLMTVLCSSIFWPMEKNISRRKGVDSYPADKELSLIKSFVTTGWSTDMGTVAAAYTLTDVEAADYTARREAEWEALVNAEESTTVFKIDGHNVDVTNEHKRKAFELLFTEEDKVVVPTYGGINSFHRGAIAMLEAAAIRVAMDKDVWTDVPINLVPEGESIMEQHVRNLQENVGRLEGATNLEPCDELNAAKQIFDEGGSEADVQRAVIKRGKAQLLYLVCQLNARYTGLGIIERIYADKLRFPVTSLTAKLRDARNNNVPSKELNAILVGERKDAVIPMVKRKSIESTREHHQLLIVRKVCSAILKGDMSLFKRKADGTEMSLDEIEKLNTLAVEIFPELEADGQIQE